MPGITPEAHRTLTDTLADLTALYGSSSTSGSVARRC